MNTRSLRFQLFTWYAALLLGSFALVGVATYIALERSLTGALEQTQVRRARSSASLRPCRPGTLPSLAMNRVASQFLNPRLRSGQVSCRVPTWIVA